MALLDHITRAIGERQDLRSIFHVVVRTVQESLPVERCWIGLEGADTAGLTLHDELLYVPDLRSRPMPLPPAFAAQDLGCCVIAPLHDEQGLIGVLIAGRHEAEAFSSGECEFLRQLSEHVELAIRQTRLHESLWSAYDELRQTQQAVLQQERLSALGQMASGIAHDINNAMSPAILYLEQLLDADRELSPRSRQLLPVVLRAIEDVAATVARLREFYRPQEMQAELVPVNINLLVKQALELTYARWRDMPQQRGIQIDAVEQLAPDLPEVLGSASELREALTNLIFNAVDAMPEGGRLTLRTTLQQDTVQVEVTDTGVGMDEETRRKCLEPFFTTKGERGTGLGLAMVYGIVQRHGAQIEISSAPGAGTTFSIRIPIPDRAAVRPAAPVPQQIPTGLRLLVIDDDALLLKTLRETLEMDAHHVTTAADGPAGIQAFRSAFTDVPFDAVITDLGMPRMDGRAVARAIKEISPATPVILLTGWGQRPDAGSDALPHVDRVIGKPPKLRELRGALAQVRGADAHNDVGARSR
jgi:signal transduction histidine kinase/CheY-like chemotaxis protein